MMRLSTLICQRCLLLLILAGTATLFSRTEAVAQQSSGEISAFLLPNTLVLKVKPALRPGAGGLESVPGVKAALQKLQAGKVERKFPRHLPPPPDKPDYVDLSVLYEIEYSADISLGKAAAMLLATGSLEYAEPLRQYEPLFEPNDPRADSLPAASTTCARSEPTRAGALSRAIRAC